MSPYDEDWIRVLDEPMTGADTWLDMWKCIGAIYAASVQGVQFVLVDTSPGQRQIRIEEQN